MQYDRLLAPQVLTIVAALSYEPLDRSIDEYCGRKHVCLSHSAEVAYPTWVDYNRCGESSRRGVRRRPSQRYPRRDLISAPGSLRLFLRAPCLSD